MENPRIVITFTDREAGVMQVLWEHGPSVVTEVQARLDDKLAYTTVLTVLRTLETKGYAGHTEEGRGHRYHAIIAQQLARVSALRHLTGKLFRGSAELLMTHLVADAGLDAAQLQRMRALLAEHDAREGEGASAGRQGTPAQPEAADIVPALVTPKRKKS